MKQFIIILTIFGLFSCTSQLPEGIKTENITRIDYQGKDIYFGDNQNNSILVPIELLEQKYIPKNISTIHLGHKLSEQEILKVFQYELSFNKNPDINFGDNALTEKIHDIFITLDIKQFNGNLMVENNCLAPIIIPKNISDKYFNSKIEKINIYGTCWNDVMKSINCKFEGYQRDNEKLTCE